MGYSSNVLIDDIIRFPSILAAPPDRIKGWMSLLNYYGIAKSPGLYGKMLKRAPFMFYIDPPMLFDIDAISAKCKYKYSIATSTIISSNPSLTLCKFSK